MEIQLEIGAVMRKGIGKRKGDGDGMGDGTSMATAQARGFPPYVLPCSPGFNVSITSSSVRTADAGSIPPLNALPRMMMSGRT